MDSDLKYQLDVTLLKVYYFSGQFWIYKSLTDDVKRLADLLRVILNNFAKFYNNCKINVNIN